MIQYGYHRPAPHAKTWNLIKQDGKGWQPVQTGLTFEEVHRLYEAKMAEQQPRQAELQF